MCTAQCDIAVPLQHEAQQYGQEEEAQQRQQQDEPQLGVNRGGGDADALLPSVLGLGSTWDTVGATKRT